MTSQFLTKRKKKQQRIQPEEMTSANGAGQTVQLHIEK